MIFLDMTYRQYSRTRWLLLSAPAFIVLAFIGLGLSSCASRIPVEIQGDLDGAPTVAEVRAHPDTFLAQRVRWGGKNSHYRKQTRYQQVNNSCVPSEQLRQAYKYGSKPWAFYCYF